MNIKAKHSIRNTYPISVEDDVDMVEQYPDK